MSEYGNVALGPYRVGEIPPPLVVTFKDSTGTAIDLSGYVARWIYRRLTPPSLTTQTATVLNQSTNRGQVQYTWVLADFDQTGEYEAEMWVGNGANRYSSVRYVWATNAAISVPSI